MTEQIGSGLTLSAALAAFAGDSLAIKGSPRQLFIKASADYFLNEGAPWESYHCFLSKLNDTRTKADLMAKGVLLWKGKDNHFRLVAAQEIMSREIAVEASACAFCGLVEEDTHEMLSIPGLQMPIRRHTASRFVHAECEHWLREKVYRAA